MATKPRSTARRSLSSDKSTPGMSKELVVETALKLIDEKGLQTFSIRNLAKTLDCYPTAIYWYTPSRHLLIAEVVTLVLTDVVPDHGLPWQDWLKALFTGYRRCIARHPNVAPLIGVNLVSNASVNVDLIEGILSKLEAAGFREDRLIHAFNAVVGAMVGFATQEFAMLPPDADELEADLKGFSATIDAGQYPMVARMAPQMLGSAFLLRWANGAVSPLQGGFDLYVDAFVSGLEALLDRD